MEGVPHVEKAKGHSKLKLLLKLTNKSIFILILSD